MRFLKSNYMRSLTMKKINWILLIVAVAALLALAACSPKPAAPTSGDQPVPAPYAGKTNPLAGKADAAAAGKVVYTANCASCHGDSGKGDGPAGASLNPKPADLTDVGANDPDDRVDWVVHEGGAAAGKSASMPAWKATLSDDQIWQVITYLRTLK